MRKKLRCQACTSLGGVTRPKKTASGSALIRDVSAGNYSQLITARISLVRRQAARNSSSSHAALRKSACTGYREERTLTSTSGALCASASRVTRSTMLSDHTDARRVAASGSKATSSACPAIDRGKSTSLTSKQRKKESRKANLSDETFTHWQVTQRSRLRQ